MSAGTDGALHTILKSLGDPRRGAESRTCIDHRDSSRGARRRLCGPFCKKTTIRVASPPHSVGQRVLAQLSGTIAVCDSASTNKLMITNLDNTVPDDEFVLSIYCLQHKNGTSVEVTTKLFDLLGHTYCIEGLFKRGDFADDLMKEARVVFERDLLVGNMESTSPEQPGDASYARSLLELCFVCGGSDGLWPVEDGTPSKRHLLANDFLQFSAHQGKDFLIAREI